MAEVKDGKRNNAYSALRKLESGDNFYKRGTFTLPGHAEDNLILLSQLKDWPHISPKYLKSLNPFV